MIEDGHLILGCDDHSFLPIILEKLRFKMNPNYILATRSSDLDRVIASSSPTLIIIYFRNNQQVIDNICHQYKEEKIPILCLLKRHENEYLRWNEQDIVFTHTIDSSDNSDSLNSKIKSLLLLISNTKKCYSHKISNHISQKSFASENGELARYVMELDQKNRTLQKIKKRIKQLYSDADGHIKKSLISIVNTIQTSKNESRLWKDFKMYFENINPSFIKHLCSSHPDLTPMDIKYCCFLKMNLSTDEIRNIFGISQESVRTHKYRLKKKLDLSKDDDLHTYVISFPKNTKHNLA